MSKPTKNKSIKTFSITQGMMADLMFFLRPMKERQQEMLFWQQQLQITQDQIVKSQGIDPAEFEVDWQGAYRTGKLVCTKKLPAPQVAKELNGNNKGHVTK